MRNTSEIKQRIHPILTGRQQILEVIPCSIQTLQAEINDPHQAKRIITVILIHKDLVHLTQSIVIPVHHHIKSRQFHSRVRIRMGAIADNMSEIIDRLIFLAFDHQGTCIQQLRPTKLRV